VVSLRNIQFAAAETVVVVVAEVLGAFVALRVAVFV
jgi:hypothetical protein